MRLVILTLTLTTLFGSFLLALGACSSSSQTPSDGGTRDITLLCVPGQSVSCVGPGGCSGGQVCGPDGLSFGACDCSSAGPDAAADTGAVPDATPGTDATPGADATTGDAASSDASATDAATDAGSPPDSSTGDGGTCSAGVTCNVSCPGGGTTTITGKVYDPAGKNPLYNISVYVPAGPLQPLPSGVPTGADACSCDALFKSGSLASAKTGPDGSFTLTNVPVGSDVPLVLQAGKWRRLVHVSVNACHDNPQPDKSLTMPGTVAPGSDDNLPDIAVSTGGADSLECLLRRVGLPTTEYVTGAATSGHVHVFSGGYSGGASKAGVGAPESNPMPNAPASSTALWDTAAHLMPYDITLLSCEGGETYGANPAALETYLNVGGRVFASHFHYAWFTGPLSSASVQSYAAPSDWGTNLATWSANGSSTIGANPVGGIIEITQNVSSLPFVKGQALQQWLSNVGALGQGGVPATEVPIYSPRYNAVVGSTNKPSQPWITSDNGGVAETMSFSFDTPVDLNPPPTGATTCGRAVYSDIHVAGDPSTLGDNMTMPPPGGCVAVDLSPQEKVLEFMLFDLSGCVVPDSSSP